VARWRHPRRFHGEKNASWEGGYPRPRHDSLAGRRQSRATEINDLVSHEDWVPTLVAAAGEPDVTKKLLAGYQAAGKTFRVHLDGYDQRDLLAGNRSGQAQGVFLLDR